MIKGSSRRYLPRKNQNMFQICVHDQKVKGFKEMHYYTFYLFIMKWLGRSKYSMLLISLKFQSLYNLVNVPTKKILTENPSLNVLIDF
jgi:hypothetical protein